MKDKKYIIITCVSMTLMSLELFSTRLFSAAFYYTFTFLILSLAMLGLGMGALVQHLFPAVVKGNRLGFLLSLIGLISLINPVLIVLLGLDTSQIVSSFYVFFKFLFVILLQSSSFFLGGIVLAHLFRENHQVAPKLYMYDLLGAGFGVVFSFFLMNLIGTSKAIFLVPFPVIFSVVMLHKKWTKLLPIGLILLMILLIFLSNIIFFALRKEDYPVKYESWDATAKITVYEGSKYIYGLSIDNASNSPIYRFDGNWNSNYAQSLKFAVDVGYLIRQFNFCKFLSLGAGGGMDVMQALQKGAGEIYAVEVNPAVNDLMSNGFLAQFTGNIYHDPKVKVITEDGRTFIRKFRNKFDIIYSYSSNSFAAMASGGFALAENYLFTTEAFADYWNALSDDGFLVLEHRYYMPRIISTVKEALLKIDGIDYQQHIAVYYIRKLKSSILLLSKRPLNDQIREHAINDAAVKNGEETRLLYPAPDKKNENIISQIIENGWQKTAQRTKINIAPLDDDKPFIAQIGLWKNINWQNIRSITSHEFEGFPISRLIVLSIIFIILLIILPLNFLPVWIKKEKMRLVPGLYFLCIGIAFMVVEVIMIQKFTLFLGASSYSILTVLLAILIGSGIGSRFVLVQRPYLPFIFVISCLILNVLFFPIFIQAFGNLSLGAKILLSVIVIFPMSFFMGMPFPIGTLRVKSDVDWGLAANGAGSILGATFSVFIAITLGFNIALWICLIIYSCALLLLLNIKSWV